MPLVPRMKDCHWLLGCRVHVLRLRYGSALLQSIEQGQLLLC